MKMFYRFIPLTPLRGKADEADKAQKISLKGKIRLYAPPCLTPEGVIAFFVWSGAPHLPTERVSHIHESNQY